MISAKPMAMVAMLALAGAGVAQEQADEQRIAELIEQLGRDDQREVASRALESMGEPAAKALIAAVLDPTQPRKGELLRVFERMLPCEGLSELEVLMLMTLHPDELSGDALVAFVSTAGTLIPYLKTNLATQIQIDDVALRTLGYDQSWSHIRNASPAHSADLLNQYWRWQSRTLGLARILFFESPFYSEISDVLNLLANEETYVRIMACDVIASRAARKSEVDSLKRFAVPSLRRVLAISHPPALLVTPEDMLQVEYGGDGIPTKESLGRLQDSFVSFDQEVHLAAARALSALVPQDPVAAACRALREPDAVDRSHAEQVLASLGSGAAEAVSYLLPTLKGTDPRELGAAITALGMIGPAAKDAIPTLEKLTEHEDPQIAERAKAALTQVRG